MFWVSLRTSIQVHNINRGSEASQDGVYSGAVGGNGKNLLKVATEAGSNPTNQMVGPGC